MRFRSCAFTGLRPMRLSFGNDEQDERCLWLKLILKQQIILFIESGISVFYTGMEQGADLWCSQIVIESKKQYPHIRLHAILPYTSQIDRWPPSQRTRYFEILSACDETVILHGDYTPTCMFERNRYLIDHAAYLLAVYDGSARDGTGYTIRYARKQKREIIFIHSDTLEVSSTVNFAALERRKQFRILSGKRLDK